MSQDTWRLKKRSILDVDVEGKKVLVRVDYNVPMLETKILDNQKILATIGTIRCLLERGASLVVLASHLGDESGHKNEKLSLQPVAEELEKFLELPVIFVNECMGPEVENTCTSAPTGSIVLLENLKFHIEEEGKAEEDSRKIRVEEASLQIYQDSLSKLASVFVNDALSLANQILCSVNNLTIETKVCGLYLKKELDSFYRLLEKPHLPFLAIFGGLKISNKIAIMENIIDKVTDIMLVGAACLTYMKVVNKTEVDKSLVEEEAAKALTRIHERAKLNKINVYLPVDFMTTDKSEEKGMVARAKVKDGIKGEVLDIGQESVKKFSPIMARSKSFLWFGAPGRWEFDSFSKGTEGLLNMVVAATRRGAFSLVVGEQMAQALVKFKAAHKVSHVSFSGDASLKLLEGKFLPGLAHLQPAVERI